VPPDEVVEFNSTADVGVHPLLAGVPNHEMALPNKIFDYMHAGLPIVVTDLRELGSFVRKHRAGRGFQVGRSGG
jgi:glycosyltransferase involved in cell wall biosynthesis